MGTSAVEYDFFAISGGGFASTVAVCDDEGFSFSAVLVYESGEEVPLNSSEGVIIFKPDGLFTVFTDDNTLLGAHELHVTA